jgi:hypothetical protein
MYAVERAEFLSDVVKTLKMGNKDVTYILDSKGTMVANEDLNYVYSASNAIKLAETDKSLKPFAAIAQKAVGGHHSVSYFSMSGQRKIATTASIAGSKGWSLVLTANLADYTQTLVISIIMETSSLALINPLLDSMQVILVDPQERARIIALLYVVVLAFTSPFGWIAGTLSSIDRRFPFMMNILLLSAGIALTYFASRVSSKRAALSS